jgi:hypothetical protein
VDKMLTMEWIKHQELVIKLCQVKLTVTMFLCTPLRCKV